MEPDTSFQKSVSSTYLLLHFLLSLTRFIHVVFTGWIAVSGAWAFFTLFSVGLLPIFESRRELLNLVRTLWNTSNPAEERRRSVTTTIDSGSIEEKVDSVDIPTLTRSS